MGNYIIFKFGLFTEVISVASAKCIICLSTTIYIVFNRYLTLPIKGPPIIIIHK